MLRIRYGFGRYNLPLPKHEQPNPTFYHMFCYISSSVFRTSYGLHSNPDNKFRWVKLASQGKYYPLIFFCCTKIPFHLFSLLKAKSIFLGMWKWVYPKKLWNMSILRLQALTCAWTRFGFRLGFLGNPLWSQTRPSWSRESINQLTTKKKPKIKITPVAALPILVSYQARINLFLFPRLIVCFWFGSLANAKNLVGPKRGGPP